ncbi:MAG: YihY/virulence factor BrkB family protein [Oscillospiraceae bacterium]|nr:YihY/virulence factor BrkB family protein [Oscillospiraceae bacterium]
MKGIVIRCINLKKRYDDCHIAAYSGYMAFYLLISVVPALAVLLCAGTVYLPSFTVGIKAVLPRIFTQQAERYIASVLGELSLLPRVPLVSLSAVFLLWAATRGIRATADGLEAIYKNKERYGFFAVTVRSVLFAAGLVGASGFSLWLMAFVAKGEDGAGNTQVYTLFAIVPYAIKIAVVFAVLAFVFAAAYTTLAKSGISFKNQLVGAGLASAGWMVFSFGYSVYIRHFSRYSVLYGSFGAVMLFLLWLYMCMNILLCGALLNKIMAERKTHGEM